MLRVWIVGTPGGKFLWHTLEEALWQVDMMSRWAKRIKIKERVTLVSALVPEE